MNHSFFPAILMVLLLQQSMITHASLPVSVKITAVDGDKGVCVPLDQLNTAKSQHEDDVLTVIRNTVVPILQGNSSRFPFISCVNIPTGCPSGYYWIQPAGSDNVTLQYCDTNERCCNSTGGWMRVANLDMTDPNQQCPSGFRLVTSPRRTCGRPGSGCVSTTFPVHGAEYSRVCGKVIAYQFGSTDAFSNSGSIDNYFVEGVSLTHGSPRQHIWTFAAAHDESLADGSRCPCSRTGHSYTGTIPSFIGQDYFCDSGTSTYNGIVFYQDDPLWDGQGCGPTSTCCSFNNPPWFCKTLPQPTRDDIELRICASSNYIRNGEDIPVESVEIYVQ